MTVPGVGKLQGSTLKTQFSGRKINGFWGVPFGETTEREHRFKAPRPKAALNNGNNAFDASYLNYIMDW